MNESSYSSSCPQWDRSNGPVFIVGASQAGLWCAARLARAGMPVEVFERLSGPDQALPRTLIVTPEFARWLPVDSGVPVLNRVFAFRVRTDGQCLEVPIGEPDLVVDRRDLIRLLAREAEDAGATIHWGVQLMAVSPRAGRFELMFLDRRSGRFFRRETRLLIAADGASSAVARSLNCNGKLTVPILQARVRTERPIDPQVVDTWFYPERTPYFFWRIPDSERTAAVGCVVPEGRSGKHQFLRFLHEVGGRPERMEAALVPLYDPEERPYRRFGEAELYLVGDAAGHVKVTTVGGTVTGLAGAEAAVRAILNGTSYLEELRALRRELNVHYLIRKVLDGFDARDYDRLLGCLNRRVLGLLRDVPRDRFASIFVRTLVAQPALLWLGARALLRAMWRR